jgi:hypothetical protein
MLMPRGSGSVAIPEYRDHPLLGNPISDDPLRSGPLFEASWTHAIHCLYYAVDSYHQLLVNGPTEADNPHHASHCFEVSSYLSINNKSDSRVVSAHKHSMQPRYDARGRALNTSRADKRTAARLQE